MERYRVTCKAKPGLERNEDATVTLDEVVFNITIGDSAEAQRLTPESVAASSLRVLGCEFHMDIDLVEDITDEEDGPTGFTLGTRVRDTDG